MAKKIPLGNDQFAIIDDEDYELVSQYNWSGARSGESDHIYAVTRLRMHRLVMNAPLGMYVDHINGDTLDNRKENLRLCTNAENQQNARARGGTSQYKGVSYNKKMKKWLGAFTVLGQTYHCGYFDDEKECARAVDKKRREVCGDFASKNLFEES